MINTLGRLIQREINQEFYLCILKRQGQIITVITCHMTATTTNALTLKGRKYGCEKQQKARTSQILSAGCQTKKSVNHEKQNKACTSVTAPRQEFNYHQNK